MASWAICTVLLLVIASEPIITTTAGTGQAGDSGDGGPAASARLNMPFDVAFDGQGNLFFSDTFNHRIRRIDHSSGTIATIAGTGTKGYIGDGGPANSAAFNGPKELAVDSGGNVWVVDTENHAIRLIDAATQRIRTLAGSGKPGGDGDGGPATKARLDRPHGVAIGPDGGCWIADTNNHRLRRVTPGQ